MLVFVRGGLGNQMFQAAHGYALAKRFGVQPQFIESRRGERDRKYWELGAFGIHPVEVGKLSLAAIEFAIVATRKVNRIGFPSPKQFLIEQPSQHQIAMAEFSSEQAPRIVSGYFQGERFFSEIADHINEHFKFPDFPDGVEAPTRSEVPVVGIHVRRGDYVTDPIARKLHLVCDEEWYRRAWNTMRLKLGECEARVYSDDPQWAEEQLGLDGQVCYMQHPKGLPAWVDMAHMSACDHFIISNSTYSWWAAYLAQSEGKQVIAPKSWFNGVPTSSLQICPSSWELL